MAAKNTWEEIPLIDNQGEKQFEMHIDEHLARIEYILMSKRIFLTHTEVARPLEGKGVGSAIIRRVLDQLVEQELELAPLCPFVAAYIKRHPEYKKILAPGYNV